MIYHGFCTGYEQPGPVGITFPVVAPTRLCRLWLDSNAFVLGICVRNGEGVKRAIVQSGPVPSDWYKTDRGNGGWIGQPLCDYRGDEIELAKGEQLILEIGAPAPNESFKCWAHGTVYVLSNGPGATLGPASYSYGQSDLRAEAAGARG